MPSQRGWRRKRAATRLVEYSGEVPGESMKSSGCRDFVEIGEIVNFVKEVKLDVNSIENRSSVGDSLRALFPPDVGPIGSSDLFRSTV